MVKHRHITSFFQVCLINRPYTLYLRVASMAGHPTNTILFVFFRFDMFVTVLVWLQIRDMTNDES